MHPVKSNAKRQNVGLTIPVATRQARKIVDQIMPGAGATVESRGSADPVTLAPVIITTVTFPNNHPESRMLVSALGTLAGVTAVKAESARITITRTK